MGGRSIRESLRRGLLVGLSALVLALGGALYGYSRQLLTGQFDGGQLAKARLLALLVKLEKGGRIEVDFAEDPMPEFERAAAPEYFAVWLDDGRPLARSGSLGGGELPRGPRPDGDPVFWDLTLPDGRAGRAVGLALHPQVDSPRARAELAAGPPLPRVHLVVARERGSLDRSLRGLSLALAGAGVLLLIGAVLVVSRALARGLRPLTELADRAAGIDASSLAGRFPVEGLPAELAAISGRLNDLLARLAASFERERRFNADVAHELRTPIAELRSLSEVALRGPDDRPGSRDAFTDAREIALQMERLVTALLALSRSHAGALPVAAQPLDLCASVREAWRPFGARALGRDQRVDFALPAAAPVQTDPTLVGSLLGNLFANAVEHTPEAGGISCGLTARAGGRWRLVLANSASALTASDLPHLFEAFWRKDAARTDGSHSGLGLALVAAVARLLGIGVSTELAGGQLRIALDFPDRPPVPRPAPAAQSLAGAGPST